MADTTVTTEDGPSTTQISRALGWDAEGNHKLFKINGTTQGGQQIGYNINQNKVVHLCVYQTDVLLTGTNVWTIINSINNNNGLARSNRWDNWKNMDPLFGSKRARIVVPASINPIISSCSVKGGFTIGQQDVVSAMKSGGGQILGKLNDAGTQIKKFGAVTGSVADTGKLLESKGLKGATTDAAGNAAFSAARSSETNAGSLISKFSQFPIANPENTNYENPGSIELEFRLGNGGLYDGEAEVIRPIAALENLLAPTFGGKDMMMSPLASPSMLYASLWGSTLGTFGKVLSEALRFIKGTFHDVVEDVANADSFVGGATSVVEDVGQNAEKLGNKIQEAVIDAQDLAVDAMSAYSTFLFIRMGNEILGPLSIENISHALDYSMVDERGYPAKGTVSMSVKYIMKPTNLDILAQHGYSVEGAGDSETTA